MRAVIIGRCVNLRRRRGAAHALLGWLSMRYCAGCWRQNGGGEEYRDYLYSLMTPLYCKMRYRLFYYR